MFITSILLITGSPNLVLANCEVKPSASSFFKFMKGMKAKAKSAGETLLKASAGTSDCQPSFELKVLDARGRVVTRVYNADTFELLAEDKPLHTGSSSSDRDNSNQNKSGSSSGGASSGSGDRDDDNDDDDDDDGDDD